MHPAGLFVLALLAPSAEPASPQSYEVHRGLTYAERDGVALLADVYQPTGSEIRPAVLCIHGGAWVAGNKNQMAMVARRLAECGMVAVTVFHESRRTEKIGRVWPIPGPGAQPLRCFAGPNALGQSKRDTGVSPAFR